MLVCLLFRGSVSVFIILTFAVNNNILRHLTIQLAMLKCFIVSNNTVYVQVCKKWQHWGMFILWESKLWVPTTAVQIGVLPVLNSQRFRHCRMFSCMTGTCMCLLSSDRSGQQFGGKNSKKTARPFAYSNISDHDSHLCPENCQTSGSFTPSPCFWVNSTSPEHPSSHQPSQGSRMGPGLAQFRLRSFNSYNHICFI